MAIIEAGAAVVGAVKTAADILRDIRNSRDPTKLRDAINDLTGHLSDALSSGLDLQVQAAALDARCRELEEENRKLREFHKEAERYLRKQTVFGGAIYVERGTPESEAASPKYCAHCFENGNRAILQPLGARQFKCPTCRSQQKM